MKVKLLKKIRKRYSIYYYPNRGIYEVDYLTRGTLRDIHGFYNNRLNYPFESIQDAKDAILKKVKDKYHKYTRKHKQSQIKHKVWHKQ